MDRRDFLKALGLLAATAPAGVAALKQMEFEPEIEAAQVAEVAEAVDEVAKESFGDNAFIGHEAGFTVNDGPIPAMPSDDEWARHLLETPTYNGLPLYTAEEIVVSREPDGLINCSVRMMTPPFPNISEVGERIAIRSMHSYEMIFEGLLFQWSSSTGDPELCWLELVNVSRRL